MRTWHGWVMIVLVVCMLAACAAQPAQPIVTTPRTYQGAGAGAVVGAGAGALIDKDNRWRGAALGAALGGILGGSLTEISSRAARESVSANQPVAYQSTDGWQRVEAVPQAPTARGCRQVRERVYQDNQLVREQIREVC
jgi:MFS family permease